MENQTNNLSNVHLGNKRLIKFFLDNLDRIYCAKKHMVEHLPEIADQAYFSDISHALYETIDDVKKQIIRMDDMYARLGTKNNAASCNGLVAMVQEAFEEIKNQKDDAALRDMSILFYMQNIESIEVASFQALQIIGAKIKNEEISQLLKENLDEAKDDRTLLLMITAKYVTS